ncbi:MAG: hypothetical protein M3R54_04745 [Chloroflexota bacterium]|nr:hypothetical protein [Chloroflexota bacterium]
MSAPPAASGRPRGPIIAAIAAVVLLVLVAALMLLRSDGGTIPSATSSPRASASAAASSTAAATATPGTGAGLGPDAKHGLITFNSIRTEDSAPNLQQPPQFARTGTAGIDFKVAVSPDGKRVAMILTGETGQQLITFTTAKPNDVTLVLDLSGGTEFAVDVVWAGDGSDYLIYSIDAKSPRTPPATSPILYSALRTADLAAKKQSEVARITTGLHLVPLAWRFDTHRGGAIEQDASTGFAVAYDVIRDNTLTDRTVITGVNSATAVRSSRDGMRVLAVAAPAVRWWPVDEPSAVKEVHADLSRGRAEYAEFRPGTNEIGVSVVASNTGPVGPPGHFEIWDLSSGKQRVVGPTVGFSRWRADGSAAISGTTLVDPDTGATTPLPGGAFKIVEVVLF